MSVALRIGTRGSALALAQTGHVADAITALGGYDVELVKIQSEGDRIAAPIASLGGTGAFATSLRMALLVGRCDLVVHSLKDLPTAPYPGLVIGAVPPRHDSRDALVARDGLTLDQLPEGASVGTGSPRRVAALKALRPDLDVRGLRGNVDTRIGHVTDGRLDAVVLAAAGLNRLGRLDEATEIFDFDRMPQAPGQGAVAVEVRADILQERGPLARLLPALDDAGSRYSAEAERALLARLEAGCAAPVGAQAHVEERGIRLRATVMAPDGTAVLREDVWVEYADESRRAMRDAARQAGRDAADRLLDAGAARLAPVGAR